MPRKSMVTRTITATRVFATVCALDTMNIGAMEFVLPRTYKNAGELEKALTRACTDPNVKVLKINDTKVEETLYGMDEQDFINSAKVLPPRGAKFDEQ